MKKIVQFSLIFHLFNCACPMIEYKTVQNLFMQLKIPDNPMKHWYDGSRWEMVDYM
jgi:hypothetical protein